MLKLYFNLKKHIFYAKEIITKYFAREEKIIQNISARRKVEISFTKNKNYKYKKLVL